MEPIDFANMWVEEDSVRYELEKWNYITIDAEEDTCFVSSRVCKPCLFFTSQFAKLIVPYHCQAREFVNQLDISTTAVEIYHTT